MLGKITSTIREKCGQLKAKVMPCRHMYTEWQRGIGFMGELRAHRTCMKCGTMQLEAYAGEAIENDPATVAEKVWAESDEEERAMREEEQREDEEDEEPESRSFEPSTPAFAHRNTQRNLL